MNILMSLYLTWQVNVSATSVHACYHESPNRDRLLPPANEVWGKVIFSEVRVKNSIHRGGVVSQHALQVT